VASAAGQNRVYKTILTLNPSSTAVAAPLAGYGTTGLNDSGPYAMNEAMGFTKWTFSLIGAVAGSGYTVTLYGTNDPKAYKAWMSSFNPQSPHGNVTLPASSWFVLPGPSEQSGTGTIANPMTPATPLFQFSGTLLAVRAVLTSVTAAAGSVQVAVEAVP